MTTMVETISPDRPSEAIRTIVAMMIEQADGDFVGVQDALPGYNVPAQVFFNHPKHHSTLALRLDESFSMEAIYTRLAECDDRFSD